MGDHRTTSELIYDEFDELIDKCEEAKFTETANALRKLRDNLPD